LVQELPINKDVSYFGDALRAVHCPDDEDNPFGTCGNLLFGGLAMTDAQVGGTVRIQFYEPAKDIAHFEVTHPGGLGGDDGVLAAPQFFSMPVIGNLLKDAPGYISSGDLNLETGEVTNLELNLQLLNTALLALAGVNPQLEAPVITFPGIRGSARASFEQRPDGLLDFTVAGSTFLPLGNDIKGDVPRFPLPFCGPSFKCASIPSAGVSLHPHFHLTTKDEELIDCGDRCPDVPVNEILEFDTFTHNTSFGDEFHLNIPELGGPATGRSHLLGRVSIQFGKQFGDFVPFSVSSAVPEGLLAEPPETPLSIDGLSLGLVGHDEILQFPDLTYELHEVAYADEPFDISLGAVNVKTGQVVGDLLYRGFIAQDLLFVLLEQNDGRIEPNSFYFEGPTLFEQDQRGQLIFRFDGITVLPFDTFRFPSPDHVKANSFIAGPGSILEPFLRIQAMHEPESTNAVMSGSGSAVSSTGVPFSYSYQVPCDGEGTAQFEYTNSGPDGGTFQAHTLGSVSCFNSRFSEKPIGDYDTVSFTAFGDWDNDDELHAATVQFSTSPDEPYISIIIDGGFLSNVNTKPEDIEDTLP
jgi:hypothetical protein